MCRKLVLLTFFIMLLGLALPVNAATLDTSDGDLLVYYRFNLDTNDSSNNLYHGSDIISVTDDFTYRTDIKIEGSSSLRWGSNKGDGGEFGRVEIPNAVAITLDGGGDPCAPAGATVVSWVRLWEPRTLTENKYRYVMGMEGNFEPDGDSRERFHLYFTNWNNKLCIGLGEQHGVDTAIIDLIPGEWYSLALTFTSDGGSTPEDGAYNVYVNGAPMPNGTVNTAPGYTGTNYIGLDTLQGWSNGGRGGMVGNTGRGTGFGEGMRGWIDDFAIYRRALTRAELALIADSNEAKAFPFEPLDAEADVLPDTNLDWIAGAGATSHDVYFGTNEPNVISGGGGTSKGNQTSTTYDPAGAGYLALDTVYYWRIDEQPGTVAGDVVDFTTHDGQVTYLNPDNGAEGAFAVEPDEELAWEPAGAFTTAYDLYLSDVFEDVNIMSAGAKVVSGGTATTYISSPPLTLEKKYYWRVVADNTSAGAGTIAAAVQNFTIGEYWAVEDFERYTHTTNTAATAVPLKDTWASTGGTAGFFVLDSADSALYPGLKSTEVDGDNSGGAKYSGIDRTYATSRDYTVNSTAESISLWYKSDDSNNTAIYAQLEDTGGTSARVTNSSPTIDGEWNEWNIALSDFTAVTKTEVKTIEIGSGDKIAVGATSQKVNYDDIRVYRPRYLTELDGDLDGDHDVDRTDVGLLAAQWQDPAVNLVTNPRFSGGVDTNSVPIGWRLVVQTTATPTSEYKTVTKVTDDGEPAPCGMVAATVDSTGWQNADMRADIIDLNDYIGETVSLSFDHKGDITADDNTFFEYRPAFVTPGNSNDASGGGAAVKRTQRAGNTSCSDCYGAMQWDWENYSHTNEVTNRYLHLVFRLASRADTKNQAFVKIDNVVVLKPGFSIPIADIDEDNDVDFVDYGTQAAEWLDTVPIFP